MPTPAAGLLGDAASAGPSRRPASGPSTATTTALAARLLPSANVTVAAPPGTAAPATAAAGVLRRIEEAGRRAASWSDTAPMPSAGRQFWPAVGVAWVGRRGVGGERSTTACRGAQDEDMRQQR